MKISIYAIGRFKSGAEGNAIELLFNSYAKKLSKPLQFKEISLKNPLPPEQTKKQESEKCLEQMPADAYLIALDENGQNLTSPEFATLLQTIRNQGYGNLVFAIGGAYGHDQMLLKRSQKTLSFGKMTWPHQMVRVMLAEQIYRAEQILAGHPYHKI